MIIKGIENETRVGEIEILKNLITISED